MTTTNDTAGPVRLTEWEQHAAAGRLNEAIVAYVTKYDWVTFVELQNRFDHYRDTRGDLCLFLGDEYPNIILWAGMSRAFVDLLERLQKDKRVFAHVASPLSYLHDGGMLKMPLAKRAHKYKELHWLPVCLRVVPIGQGRGRKKGV
jgi:hypothetical protein